jgi:hypothetical protein
MRACCTCMSTPIGSFRTGPIDLDQPLGWDEDTPISCRACLGDFDPERTDGVTTYHSNPCRRCIRGAMTQRLLVRWQSHRSGVMRRVPV